MTNFLTFYVKNAMIEVKDDIILITLRNGSCFKVLIQDYLDVPIATIEKLK